MRERISQLITAFRQTREVDDRLIPYMLIGAAVTLAVFIGLGFLLSGGLIVWSVLGVFSAVMTAFSVFGRRAQKAQYAMIEDQPGAAAAVANAMRGQWFVTPAVAVTRKQEFVHRLVGRPGIVLLGEGGSSRVKQLLGQERKRHERAAGASVPIHTVVVGNGKDQVPLGKLQVHVQKLPRELKKNEVPKLDRRLTALNKANIPMPRGYMPRPGKKAR